jgi:hypothetical protein
MKRLAFIVGSVHCLSKAREVQEKPGMNTTAGLEGSPVDSAQILVPSAEVTLTAITEAMRETRARREANFMVDCLRWGLRIEEGWGID